MMNFTDKLKDRIMGMPGDIGIYYYDLFRDTGYFAGNKDIFPSLGIAKLVVMIEVFRQAEEGLIDFDDEFVLKKEPPFTIPETEYEATVGILNFFHEGVRLTIRDLVYMMIVISDNTAFNVLLTKVGLNNVNNTMKRLGLIHTRVSSLLFEIDDYNDKKDNYHSVREIGSLLKRLYKKQLISSSASEKMGKLLLYHQRRDIMSFFSSQSISVAQQTGFDIDALHEAAIVNTEHPFILSMSMTNKGDTGRFVEYAEYAMKDIAMMCYHDAMK